MPDYKYNPLLDEGLQEIAADELTPGEKALIQAIAGTTDMDGNLVDLDLNKSPIDFDFNNLND